jgi:hypothetical protein
MDNQDNLGTQTDENVRIADDTVVEQEVETGKDGEQGQDVSTTETKEAELPKGIEKRLAKLTKDKYESQKRIKELEARIAEIQNPKQSESLKSAHEFTSDAEYIQYIAEQKADEKIAKMRADAELQRVSHDIATVKQQSFMQKVEVFKEDLPDYVDVVSKATIQMRGTVLKEIADSDFGPKIAYYLAKNPDRAEYLNTLDGKALDREMGRLETVVENYKSDVVKASITKATATPKVGGSQATPDKSKLSYDKWLELRNAGKL